MRLSITFALLMTLISVQSALAAKKASKTLNPQKIEQPQDLKSQALDAAQAPSSKKASASEIQIPLSSSLLMLKDPRPEVTTRSFKYLFGLKLEPMTNSGIVTNDLNENFDFGRTSGVLFPTISLGLSRDINFMTPSMTNGQIYIQGGFLSQEAPANLKNSFLISDARLNSTVLNVGGDLAFLPSILYPVTLTAGAKYGVLNYTQSSSSTFAQFSKSSQFYALQLGANYHLEKNWQLLAAYNFRQLLTNTQINNAPHRLEVGAQVQW